MESGADPLGSSLSGRQFTTRSRMDNHALEVGGHGVFMSAKPSRAEIHDRRVSLLARIHTMRLRAIRKSADALVDAERQLLSEAAQVLSSMTGAVYVDDTAGPTVDEIEAKVRALVARDPMVALLLIDDASHVEGGEGREERIRLGRISRRIAKLTKELRLATVILLQPNQKAVEDREDKRVTKRDLTDSTAFERDAHWIGLLHNEAHHDASKSPTLETTWAKARAVQAGVKTWLRPDPSHMDVSSSGRYAVIAERRAERKAVESLGLQAA